MERRIKIVNIKGSKFSIFCCLAASMMLIEARADNFHSHADIIATAKDYLLDHVRSVYNQRPDIRFDKLDSRLKLVKCSKPLEVFLPPGSRDTGRMTLGVRCAGHQPWKLYLPAKVSLYKEVLVAAHPMSRGHLLTRRDLKMVRQDLAGLPRGYISKLKDGLGMKLKRNLLAGTPLTPAMIAKPRIIKRGQVISIVVQSGGIEVRMKGEALAEGAVGERIRVVNRASRKKLEGIVLSSGEVQVKI